MLIGYERKKNQARGSDSGSNAGILRDAMSIIGWECPPVDLWATEGSRGGGARGGHTGALGWGMGRLNGAGAGTGVNVRSCRRGIDGAPDGTEVCLV